MIHKDNLKLLDQKHLWHPFTQQLEWHQDIDNSLIIQKAKGIYLYDIDGKSYMDGTSSLWVNIHGHGHPKLDQALQKQIQHVSHTTFLGLSHDVGILLARQLIQVLPSAIERVFYSDNGSTSVEVALKMAYQYHLQKQEIPEVKRTEFIALEGSYHGDSIGAVSVGGIDLFHEKFKKLLFKTHFSMSPHCTACPYNKKSKSKYIVYQSGHSLTPKPGDYREKTGCHWECLSHMQSIMKKTHENIAAVITEPCVQGANEIQLMPEGYLKGVEMLCRTYHILLIVDEVATGFGRTGALFASQHEGVQADFVCLGKGISGGYLPLAATCTTDAIYQSFLGAYEEFKTFFHGHTYTANPLACRVGITSLELILNTELDRHVRDVSKKIEEKIKTLLHIKQISQIRQIGYMIGIELYPSFINGMRITKKICIRARSQGLIIRPIGNTIILMPPLISTEEEIEKMIDIFEKCILMKGE